METKFFTYNQNNSGGYYVENDTHGVCEVVIIEAKDKDDAWSKLEAIGGKVDGFWNYCGCCGERWSSWMDESDGTEVPMIYGEPVEDSKKSMFRHKCFVHYLNGEVKRFDFNEN